MYHRVLLHNMTRCLLSQSFRRSFVPRWNQVQCATVCDQGITLKEQQSSSRQTSIRPTSFDVMGPRMCRSRDQFNLSRWGICGGAHHRYRIRHMWSCLAPPKKSFPSKSATPPSLFLVASCKVYHWKATDHTHILMGRICTYACPNRAIR